MIKNCKSCIHVQDLSPKCKDCTVPVAPSNWEGCAEPPKFCSWKPIEPVCGLCRGTGKVYELCIEKTPERHYPDLERGMIPCPSCQPKQQKSKRLTMVVKWVENRLTIAKDTNCTLGSVSKVVNETYYRGWIYRYVPEKLERDYDTLDQAKAAVEEVLGVEGVEI